MIPKKSLGQNFLTSVGAVLDIIEAGDIQPGEKILEIGPGKGVLTEKLLEKGADVVAVEKDTELVAYLNEKFRGNPHVTLISQDILEFDPEKHGLHEHQFKLIANIPYYITGEIFRKFLGGPVQPSRMVLLVQKEVAERVVAKDKAESILSMSVKAYGEPKTIATVKAGSFFPKPSVDSAIILIQAISRSFLGKNEQKFFKIVKKGFAHKRKLLKGNLETTEETLISCEIDPKSRPQNLTKEQWLCLTTKI